MRLDLMPNQGGRITAQWRVTTNDGVGALLGLIKWHAPWRKYAFFPADGTLFEPDCLRDMASTLTELTLSHRGRVRARRAARERVAEDEG